MAKWVCNVCGYVYEGETAPEKCPVCGAPASKFRKQEEEMTWAAEHVVSMLSVLRPMYRMTSRKIFVQTSMASALRLACIWQ